MNAKQIEVHKYYKAMYPKTLILYQLPNNYAVLGADVEMVSKLISTIRVSESGVGLLPDDVSVLSELGSAGAEVQLIAYRNRDGILDFPDAKLLKAEKEMDY
jgi:hypothetical protein